MRLAPLLHRLTIVTKDAELERFAPRAEQSALIETVEREMTAGKPVRIIVLKARQIGISTATSGIFFSLAFLRDNVRGMQIAHEQDVSEHLLSMMHTYWENFPFRALFTPRNAAKNKLGWVETNSGFTISTARNVKAGRSRTLQLLHASEVAFWDKPEITMLGLRQAVPNRPGTVIIIESTANGVGNWFYDTWKAAERGDNEYIPLFFPWWQYEEYSATASAVRLYPYDAFAVRSDPDVRRLVRMMKREGYEEDVIADRLSWRKWAIDNLTGGDLNKFRQEYPAYPEEAFISTGVNVFPKDTVAAVYEKVPAKRGMLVREHNGKRISFIPDSHGNLTVFRPPSKDVGWGVYLVSGDPTFTLKNDYACAQVINRHTLEQVATWRGRIDPGTFGEVLVNLATYYNNATLTCEIEGPGYMTIGRIQGLHYPHVWKQKKPDRTPGKLLDHYGWSTNVQSKGLALGWLLKVIIDKAKQGTMVIHDAMTYDEMVNYVSLEGGGYGPASPSGHDDTVMSLAIAMACHFLEPPLSPYVPPEHKQQLENPIMDPEPSRPWDEWGPGFGVA